MPSITTRFAELPHDRPLVSLIIAIFVCEGVGASGGIFTAMGLESWYPSLVRPDLAPPNWVFAPVWTTLFALMGVAVWLIWRDVDGSQASHARFGLWVFAGHFVVNLAWSAVFFGARSLAGGFAVIVLLWLAILATIWAFDRVDRRAALLLVPYLAWVSFAGYLNYMIWVLNT